MNMNYNSISISIGDSNSNKLLIQYGKLNMLQDVFTVHNNIDNSVYCAGQN